MIAWIKYRWFRFWRKRLFSDRMMVEHLRLTMLQDNQWLHHDATARELTERYLSLLEDDWEKINVESSHLLRERLGLQPPDN